MANYKKSGGTENKGGFRGAKPAYRGGPKKEGYPKKDGYAPRYGDGPKKEGYPKKDGYAPRYGDGPKKEGYPKKDGYAPRYGDGPKKEGYPKKDGYAPRYGDGPKKEGYPKKDGYAPRYGNGPKKEGYPKKDGFQKREGFDRGAKHQDKGFSGDGKPYYRKPGQGGSNAPNERDGRPQREQERKPQAAPAEREDVVRDELPYLVMGRNAVRESVKSGRSIDKILVSKEPDGSLREIMGFARDRNIRVDEVEKAKLDELCMPFGHGGKTGNHQGIVAQVPGVEYCELSDMLNAAREKNEKPFIILLDGIEDPHNLGSIIRSAVCAGAHGVVIPKRRSASVTAAACKASAGATEYCRVARVSNLSGAIDRLKDDGLWICGADMEGKPMAEVRMEGALALVIGGEGEGISRLVREKCDFLAKIPLCGPIDSLNASVAAAILMFEKRRQDGAAK